MENKKEFKEKKSIFERVKTTSVKKISRTVVVIFFIFAMVFATITSLGFKTFDAGKWAANMLIMIGILVFGLVMGESGGIDYYRGLDIGVYRANAKEYNEFNKQIQGYINNFDYWYEEALPQELINKKVRFLVKRGLKIKTARDIVMFAKLTDINSLVHEESTKIRDTEHDKDIYIEKIEAYQEEAVKWVLEGKIILDAPNANYFTTLYNDELNDISLVEVGPVIVKRRKRVKNTNRAVRIATSVVVSAVWASLTVYELMKGDSLDAWMNLISRLAGLFTSILSGYLSAKVMVNLEARQIKNKYEVLVRYSNDCIKGDFKVKDEQAILKEKYEKQLKRDEEHKKNVIDPEVVGQEKRTIEMGKPKALENKINLIK